MFEGIHHIAIIVRDYDVSKRFYVETLGFQILRETFREERESWKLDLKVPGGAQIELFSFPSPAERPSRPEACGLRHLAFQVADLDRVIGKLEGQGVTVEPVRIDSATNARFTFFKDPDGLPLEVYEITKRHKT